MELKKTPQQVDSSSTEEAGALAAFRQERGLDYNIAQQAGLHLVLDKTEYEGMLAIPYQKRSGGVWQTRYKTGHGKPKYLDEPGANLHLYNPQFLGPHSPEVWFTEGEIDALILWQLGIPAIGISGNTKYGTPEFQQSFKLLFNRARIVSAVDGDEAGEVAHKDLVQAFGPKVVRFKIPGGLDVNDYYLLDEKGMKDELDRLTNQDTDA